MKNFQNFNMNPEELLPVEDCCANYNIEYHFLEVLQQHDLIEIIDIHEQHFLHVDALENLEKMLRLHYDLDINVEGLEVINNLLIRLKNQQQEIINLKNKLKIYGDKQVI